jgi:hypothetical protein
MFRRLTSPLISLILLLLLIALLVFLGPEEKSLGANVRVVYLHGAWVLTALVAFVASGLAGLGGVLLRYGALHRWSRALGRTGILFWVTYLPLSLWAMQTNWNGLFLAEPRWRLALIFAITGVLLQLGLWFTGNALWTSVANILFILALVISLGRVGSVMHPPPSPIFDSGIWQIELYFIGLNVLTLLAAWQVGRWWYLIDQRSALEITP